MIIVRYIKITRYSVVEALCLKGLALGLIKPGAILSIPRRKPTAIIRVYFRYWGVL